jgi:hypothetical protein
LPGATFAASLGSAPTPAPELVRTIPEIHLPNGKVLRNVELKSYSGDPVGARWDGGAGTIPRKYLPGDIQAVLPAVKKSTTDSTGRPLLTEEKGEARTLKGQAFIATRNGENAKLGGVLVAAYSASDYAAQLKWLRLGPLAKIKTSLKQGDNLEKAGQAAPAADIRKTAVVDERKAYDSLPRPANHAETDADGRFTLTHHISGPFVLCAVGQRTVGDETEYYRWVIASEEIQDPNNLLLRDTNQTGYTK